MLFSKVISLLLLLIVAAASPIRPRAVRSVVENSFLNSTGANGTLPSVLSAAVLVVPSGVPSVVPSVEPSAVPSAVPSAIPSAVPSADLLDILNRVAANGAREGMAMVLESYNASGWCAVQQASWCPQTISSMANTIAADAVNGLDFDADRCGNACILESMCSVTGNATAMGLRSADFLLTRFNLTGSQQSHDDIRRAYSVLSSDDCVVTDRLALDQAVATYQVTETSVESSSVTVFSGDSSPAIVSSGVSSPATISLGDSSPATDLPVAAESSPVVDVAGEVVPSDSSESDVYQQKHDGQADRVRGSVGHEQHDDDDDDDDDDHHLGAILGSTMGAGAVMGLGSAAAHHIATGPGPSLLGRLFGAFSGGVSKFIPHATHAGNIIKNALTRGSTSTLKGIVLSESSGSLSSGSLPLPPPVPPQVPVQGKFPPWDATPPLNLIPEAVEPPHVQPPHYNLPGSLPQPVPGAPIPGAPIPPVPAPPAVPLPPLPPQPPNPYDAVAQHQSHVLETIPEDSALDFTRPSETSSDSYVDYDDYNSDASSDVSDEPVREPARPLRHTNTLDNLRPLPQSESLDSLRPLRGSEGSVEGVQPGDLQYPPGQGTWANPPLNEPPNAWNEPDIPKAPTNYEPQHRPMRPSDYDEGSDTLYGVSEASEGFPTGSESSEDLFRGSTDSDPVYEPGDAPYPQGPPTVSEPGIPMNPPLEPLVGSGPPPEPAPPSSPSESLSEPQSDSPPSEPATEPQPESESEVEEPSSEAPTSPEPVDSPLEPQPPSSPDELLSPEPVPQEPEVPSPPSSPVAPPEPHLFEGPPKYQVFENKYAKETLLSITSEAEVAEIYSKAGASFSNNKQLPYKLLDADNRPIKNVWRDPSTLTQLPGTVEEVDGRFMQRLPQLDGVAEMPPWAAAQATPAPIPTLPAGMTYDEAYPEAYDAAESGLTDSASFEPPDDPSDYQPVDDPAHDNQIDALDAAFEIYEHDERFLENDTPTCWETTPFVQCAATLPPGVVAKALRLRKAAELSRSGRSGRVGRPPRGIEHDYTNALTGEFVPGYFYGNRGHGG